MTAWKDVQQRIDEHEEDNDKWRSMKSSLTETFAQAEKWGVDPEPAFHADISKLQEIVHSAKKAIASSDKERLDALFKMANSMSLKELRIELRGDRREVVSITKEVAKPGSIIHLSLTEEQFEKVKSATEHAFRFEEEVK